MVIAESVNPIPEIYCAVSIFFDERIDISLVVNELKNIGIIEFKIRNPKLEEFVCIDLAITKNVYVWEINDALTIMFSKIDNKLNELKSIAQKYSGDVYIDIAFYHYESYPSLVFYGANMKKICFLEASISIDPQ